MTPTPTPTTTAPSPAVLADHRARVVVLVTLAVGAALLAATINVDSQSPRFAWAGLALAAVWATGFALAPGWRNTFAAGVGRHAVVGSLVGLATFGLFVAAAWIARRLDVLVGPIDDILRQADEQQLVWVIVLATVNAVAEELFFRGALMSAFAARYAIAGSTTLYVLVTVAGGNLALALAAAVVGTVFAWERLLTGSLAMPIATHLTWTLLMVTAFPRS